MAAKEQTAKETESEAKSGPDVIDIEAEDISPQVSSASSQPMKSKSGKAGWIIAGFGFAFIGGLYATPYFEDGLERLGWKEAAPVIDQTGVVTALETQLQTTMRSLTTANEVIADQSVLIEGLQSRLAQVEADMQLLAASSSNTETAIGADQLAALQSLRADVDSLLANAVAGAGLSAGTQASSERIEGLTGAIALARKENALLATRLETLTEKLALLEAVNAQTALAASPRGRLAMHMMDLGRQIETGAPFAQVLDVLRSEAGALSALDQQSFGASLAVLESHAATGLNTYEDLVRGFDEMATAAVNAEAKADGSFLANLFTVRRTDAGADGIDAVLLRAERSLLARDIAGAVAALADIPENAKPATTVWVSKASAFVDANKAVDTLFALVSKSGDAS